MTAMRRDPRFLPVFAVLFLVSVTLGSACRRREIATSPPDARPPEYEPTATVKDLMLSIVDPSADDVWLSVTTVQSQQGVVETKPRNDEEWMKVRRGAITLMEASNLLLIPGRHVAGPGEKSETPGVELEPAEMEVLINKDRAAWNARAKGLHDAALDVLHAVDARDSDKVFEIGEQIERACEHCHSQYWYPNEKIPQVPSLQ
jgi:hypothetical protein